MKAKNALQLRKGDQVLLDETWKYQIATVIGISLEDDLGLAVELSGVKDAEGEEMASITFNYQQLRRIVANVRAVQ